MFDLGPHASFIVAAYGVTVIAIGALVFATLEDDRKQRRALAELERKGIRRRSAAQPASPTVKSTTKKKAPAKRRPAKPGARKTASARKTSSARKTPS